MINQFVSALAFSATKHRDQRRKDVEASPYINHPIALVDVLVNEGGILNWDVLCAALLHDTIEDTQTTADELIKAFGKNVASIVLEVTDDKALAKEERKLQQIAHAPHSSHEAKLVKLADKICNLRDILASPPSGWGVKRKQEYFEWAAAVVAGIRGSNSKLEKIFDALLEKGRVQHQAELSE
jgi:guanosine-3',5'-bis(diphosphate) 3'-pyrophosphohydrolase